MIKTSPSEDATGDWQACKGEVGHLVHRLRWRRRSTRLRRGGLLATLVIVTVCGNYFYSDVATELSVKASGSPCDHYTQELRAFYCDKSLNELDAGFWEHLSRCPDCQRDFRFFGGISHNHVVAHASPNNKRAQAPTASHPISLEEVLRQATFAARR
jgi:hypothetical protein